jgi:Family of unknown function (DUF6502)
MTVAKSRRVRTLRPTPLEEMMRSLLLFLLDAGLSRAELGALLDAALGHAFARRADAAKLRQHSSAISGLMFAWHREPGFVTRSAEPRALALRGARASVECLVRRHCAPGEIETVIEALRKQRLVRRCADGRYLPAGPVATFRDYGPELGGYVGEAILNLMNTIQANLRSGRRTAPLIERAALVRDLSPRQAAQYRSFVQEQGTAFLANVDDWLESHRVAVQPTRTRRGSRKAGGVTAGVHVFAFLGNAPVHTAKGLPSP